MSDCLDMNQDTSRASAIEPDTLERLFALGDGSLRLALCAQLHADFSRLHAAVEVVDGARAGRAAHELKGLAATVGALRLADMARDLDTAAQELAAELRAGMVAPLQREIGAVLRILSQASARPVAE